MKKETAEKILRETESGYDLIADKFSATRKHFWRGMEFIGDCAQDGDRILDFGCGNGRLLELIGDKKLTYIGIDTSQKLIDIARERYGANGEIFQKISGQPSLPFPDDYFNAIYSIAVFHHLPSEKQRKEIITELYRALKPDGQVVITVWNLWPTSRRIAASRGGQKKYFLNILRNWGQKLIGRSDLDWNDCYISFTDNEGRIFNRYHHAFRLKELKKMFSLAGFTVEKCEVIGGRNIVLVARKHCAPKE